jgi:hypothetical protein
VNARIRSIERESGLEIYGLGLDRAKWEAAMTKFTELIVRECMSNLYLNGYDDAMIQIQRHFGVEE